MAHRFPLAFATCPSIPASRHCSRGRSPMCGMEVCGMEVCGVCCCAAMDIMKMCGVERDDKEKV